MTQATTWGVPRSGPATPATTFGRADDSFDALLSQHKGATAPTYAVAGTRWWDDSVAGTITIKEYDGADWIVVGTIDTAANTFVPGASGPSVREAIGAAAEVPISQCELILDGANLRLSRRNGCFITINGVAREIPSGGVALAATGLTVGTLYYIYAYMDSGTMTLEAASTAPATHTDGTRIKTGDATRALVGMARPVTGPAWADSVTQRLVRSWFNRRPVAIRRAFTTTRSTTSTSFVELNTEIRCDLLIWADETIAGGPCGYAFSSGADFCLASVGFDGVSDRLNDPPGVAAGTSGSGIPAWNSKSDLSEGYHYATFAARSGSGSIATFGSATPSPVAIELMILPEV